MQIGRPGDRSSARSGWLAGWQRQGKRALSVPVFLGAVFCTYFRVVHSCDDGELTLVAQLLRSFSSVAFSLRSLATTFTWFASPVFRVSFSDYFGFLSRASFVSRLTSIISLSDEQHSRFPAPVRGVYGPSFNYRTFSLPVLRNCHVELVERKKHCKLLEEVAGDRKKRLERQLRH